MKASEARDLSNKSLYDKIKTHASLGEASIEVQPQLLNKQLHEELLQLGYSVLLGQSSKMIVAELIVPNRLTRISW